MPFNKKYFLNLFVLSLILILNSCTDQKKYIYFQHKENDTLRTILDSSKVYSPIFKTDDMVSISVSAIDPEVVRPFNLNAGKSENSKSDGTNSIGYLIDVNGNIEFPVLGTIKIGGLTRVEASNLLKERLKSYIVNPIVNVRLTNFKVTILGEVAHPGVYNLNHELLSLPEALGLAGDLTINGVRENVLIIRDENGKKTETRIDLTSRDLFKSDVYYLHQNDIVYVEPSKTKINSNKQYAQYGSIVVSGASLIVNIINLMSNK